MSGYRARIRCSMSLSTRRSCACRWTSSATSFGWLDRAIAGAATAFFGAPNGSASRGVMGQKRLARALRRGQTSGSGARDGEHLQFRAGCGTRAIGVTVLSVDFTAHQAPMALQRLKDQGGFNGDRIESCAMPTVFASGSDWLRTVIDKSDLAEGNLAGTRIRETTFAHTALRKARLRSARLERVELYFCDLNEIDAAQINARRLKIHGCEAMNAVFSGAQLAAELRARLRSMPSEQLIELCAQLLATYVVEGVVPLARAGESTELAADAAGEESFAQMLKWLKAAKRDPVLERFIIDGENISVRIDGQ